MKYQLSKLDQAREARDELFRMTALNKTIEIKEAVSQRTNRQNAAMHKYFELLATELNDAGLSMLKVLKPGAEIPWSADSIKQYLWKPVQEAQLGKKSTTQLTTKQVNEVYETLNRHLGERFSLHVPFPSIEDVLIRGDK